MIYEVSGMTFNNQILDIRHNYIYITESKILFLALWDLEPNTNLFIKKFNPTAINNNGGYMTEF